MDIGSLNKGHLNGMIGIVLVLIAAVGVSLFSLGSEDGSALKVTGFSVLSDDEDLNESDNDFFENVSFEDNLTEEDLTNESYMFDFCKNSFLNCNSDCGDGITSAVCKERCSLKFAECREDASL